MLAASARGAAPIPMAKPPAAVAAVMMKWRRVRPVLCAFIASPLGLHEVGGAMDGTAKPLVSAATANVGDASVDIGIGRVGVALEERHRCHDLPGLAVAALRDV